MPYALCPMPYALCPMPYALCPMPSRTSSFARKAIYAVKRIDEINYSLDFIAENLKVV
jgi:hypothetical protein